MMKYISKYLFIYSFRLINVQWCTFHLMMRHSSMYIRSFFLFMTYYLYKYLMKKVNTRASSAWWTVGGYKRIYVYIQNQTRERNANVVVLSYRFNRDKEIERISRRYYHFLICSNITTFFFSLLLFFLLFYRYKASSVDQLLEKYKFYQPINTDNQSIITINKQQ